MDAQTILLGAAVVVVGYIAYRAMQPAPATAAAPPSSSTATLLGKILASDTANEIGAGVLSKASVWLGGSSSW